MGVNQFSAVKFNVIIDEPLPGSEPPVAFEYIQGKRPFISRNDYPR